MAPQSIARSFDALKAVLSRPETGPSVAALLALALGAWTFDYKLSLSGDNAEFVTLARSVANGQGLTYTNLPDQIVATKYPPVFPFMLAPIAWLFEGSLWSNLSRGGLEFVAMKWLVVLMFSASAAILFLLVRDLSNDLQASVTTLVAITNSLTVSYASQVMSEVPYVMWSLLALWLLGRGLASPDWRGNRWVWAGVAAMIIAYLTRSVGICLITAVILYLIGRQDWRRTLIVGGICFCAMLPWALRNSMAGGSIYYQVLLMVNPYRPEKGYLDTIGVLYRLMDQLILYVNDYLPEVVLPLFAESSPAMAMMAILVSVLAVATVFLCIRRRQHLLVLTYAALFVFTLLTWPWGGTRFLVPLMPILWFLAVHTLAEGLGWLGARQGLISARTAGAAALVLMLALNLHSLFDLARESRNGYSPAWRNYIAAGLWLRTTAEPDATISCRKAFMMHLVSGRQTVTYAFDKPAALLAHFEEQGVDYAVVDNLPPPQTEEFLVPAISSAWDRFQVVYSLHDPDTFVVRFNDGGKR